MGALNFWHTSCRVVTLQPWRLHAASSLVACEPSILYTTLSLCARKQIPRIGMATTRRALRALVTTYNDESIQALACFICGCTYTTFEGPAPPPDEDGVQRVSGHCEISIKNLSWFRELERHHPGSLLNNCSCELWCKRYLQGRYAREGDDAQRSVLEAARPRPPTEGRSEYGSDEWCLRVPLYDWSDAGLAMELFGCTEDNMCVDEARAARHAAEMTSPPYCRRMCASCRVPICHMCATGLWSFNSDSLSGTVPSALANDNFYGYALKLLVERKITWLECAAASLVWTNIMVYYLEAPYGHLMQIRFDEAL